MDKKLRTGVLNSKIKVAFALNDLDDARFFSNAMGHKTVKVVSNSVSSGYGAQSGSSSKNVHYQSRALMTPDEIMQMSDKNTIILMEGRHPIKAGKCYWFKEGVYRKLLQSYKTGETR